MPRSQCFLPTLDCKHKTSTHGSLFLLHVFFHTISITLFITMSMLHLSYDDSAFLHPRDPSYDMPMALDMKPSSFLSEQYMLDHLLHPLAPMPASHSMPHFDMHHAFAPSQYHMYALPFELQRGSDVHHPIPIRPVSSEDAWAQQVNHPHYPGEPAASDVHRGSISQPSMFVPSSSTTSRVTTIAPQAADPSDPPPPWTMSGSLDPSTGIYQVAPEHPRIRTAQACEKCRGRKAKVYHILSTAMRSPDDTS